MKTWKIEIREQSFEFRGDYASAKAKIKELIEAGLWYINLSTKEDR